MTTILNRILAAISHFVKSGEAFTLVDVSDHIKNDGGPFFRHTEIREVSAPIVDWMIEEGFGDYEHATIGVVTKDGGVATAKLYFPYGYDPADYKDNVVNKSNVKVSTTFTKAPTASQVALTQNVKNDEMVCNVRKSDGALEIPKALVALTGARIGFCAFNHPNSITLEDSQSLVPDVTIKHKGTRIRSYVLIQSNLGDRVRVKAVPGRLILSRA